MEPKPPDEQPTSADASAPPPSTLRPWEVDFAQTPTPQGSTAAPQAGQPQAQPPPWTPGGAASQPAKKSRVGLIIGLIAVVFVVGVIVVGIVGFFLLRKTINTATDQWTSIASPTSRTSTPAPTPATVSVAGQTVPISSSPYCAKAGNLLSISIAPSQGIAATLTLAPPQVQSVSLGTVNGLTLAYSGSGDDSATVTQVGDTFSISGTATGIDFANGMQTVTKPFDIRVSCPGF